uniref:Uncharacterized protein n=1 Tax=Tanacetum cinerariifolium TaxID=118510 RepID=A0A6L2JEX8_TANCI|nr:hypothetical protein [Tanacetum cinerariifolium]
MRSEVATSRDCIAQLNVVMSEFEAMGNQEEVHDSWLAAKDARRGEQGRLDGLNDVIDDALEEIEKLETNVEILEGAADVLAEIAEYPRLGDKIKYVFECSRGEDESLSRMMVDLYIAYRVSLGKKRRLIAELEAAGEVDGYAKCLEHMKVVVARDDVTLEDMEIVWACCQVGKILKASFVADMEVQK